MQSETHLHTERLFVRHPRLNHVQQMMDRCRNWSEGAPEPYCLLVVGETGMGKSTLIKDYIAKNPRAVTTETTTVPVLSASIPAPATMKGMATELLTKLGDPLAERGTLNQQTWRLRRLLETCRVEMIILDEFNHFIDRDSDKVLRSVADWLKVLIDTTGIPMVLVGTPNSRSVLNANEQLRRRFGTHERLEPFTWAGDGKQQFCRFLMEVDSRLPLPERSHLDDETMADRFFRASHGSIASVMKLVRKATHIALDKGLPRLDTGLLSSVFAEDLLDPGNMPNPFLDAPPQAPTSIRQKTDDGISSRLKGKTRPIEPSFTAS